MGDSAHIHDAKVEKPIISTWCELSELVMVYLSDGRLTFAQYKGNDLWIGEGGEEFGHVDYWYDGFPIPHGFHINYSEYGGEI